MSYATKYRPFALKDVVGNQSIVTSLRGALKDNRIPSAFLFTGGSGRGKTTLARVIFNHLLCEKGSACGECDTCRSGSLDDLIEKNAASERGIEEMRKLIEQARYMPQYARKRVIILDEVHKLTSDAKDALLTTLEEPPKDTLFILCTTEPEKVPVTVRTRCQCYTVSEPDAEQVVTYLDHIARSEDVEFSQDILSAIFGACSSSIRESVQLLESVVNFKQGHKKGVTDEILLSFIASASVSGNGGVSTFEFVQSLYQDDYPTIHRMLLESEDIVGLLSGAIWLNGFVADVLILKGAKNKNVWWTPANKEMLTWIKSKENRPKLVTVLEIHAGLIDTKFSLGFAGLSDRHLVSAKLYNLLKRVSEL